jgi:hypothetical protein
VIGWTFEKQQDGNVYRVYFDSNEGPDNERYGLWLNRSREELGRIPGGPQDGMVITIYMIGEIEMEAVLQWDQTCNAWTARPIEESTRSNHKTWD